MKVSRPTLKQIATLAGVSIATVSLSLKDHPRIPPATAERIKSIAAQIGYIPDPMLSALSVYRTSARPIKYQETIAWINCWSTKQGWRHNSTFLKYYESAREEAERRGFKLEEFWAREPGLTSRRCTQILMTRNIRGLILGPMPSRHVHINLEWQHFSTVAIGHTFARPRLNIVSNNQYNSIINAMRQIYKYGYRRIGLVLVKEYDERANRQWTAGFLVEQHRYSQSNQIPPLLLNVLEEKNFQKWFVKNKPEVIVGLRTPLTTWLANINVHVPRDVGYVDLNCSEVKSKVSGIDQNLREIGSMAANYLINMLQQNERGIPVAPRSLMIDGKWVDGGTLLHKYRS